MASSEGWLLLFIFLTVTIHFAFVTSQFEAVNCSNNANYTSESLYRADLNNLLGSLFSNMGNNGFYNASVGKANAIALCRANIQLSTCRGCVKIAAEEILRRCPEQFQAIMWFQYCIVRYSNQTILGKFANEPGKFLQSTGSVENEQQFIKVRGMPINNLRAQAANGGALRKAAAGNRTAPANQTIFAMVQCTPDLSPEKCTSCLARAAEYIHY